MTNNFGLIILDGWGLGDHSKSDAIFNANTPFMDELLATRPNATLKTSGEDVGLPDGQMGNSEVGHLNIGAGRIVYQELTRINKSIREGEFFKNPELQTVIATALENNRNLKTIILQVEEARALYDIQNADRLCSSVRLYLPTIFIRNIQIAITIFSLTVS